MPWVDSPGDGHSSCNVCGRRIEFDSGSQGTGYPYCPSCGESGVDHRTWDAFYKAPVAEPVSATFVKTPDPIKHRIEWFGSYTSD